MTSIEGNRNERDLMSRIDFYCSVLVEKKPDCGEDAMKRLMNRDAALFGVFDGCGGAGSKLSKYKGKTEAYVASRATADAVEDWFDQPDPSGGWRTEALKERAVEYLRECEALAGETSLLIGGIKKKFPTTAALGICRLGGEGLEVDFFWAGDSRVYLLNDQGLAQLTEDDLGGIDAMDNLTKDGLLTNMINLTVNFDIHRGKIVLDRPGFIFAATDGCFGYLSTPMEFEYLLLETLLNADSVASPREKGAPAEGEELTDFQNRFAEALRPIAGDDYTLCGYAVGFGSLQNMKRTLLPRANEVFIRYISRLNGMSREEKTALWTEYRDNYYRMICRP